MVLPREHLLDELATAYVQAVAAKAGAITAVSRLDYGIDGTLSRVVRAKKSGSIEYKYVPEGFSVDFQLKATTIAKIKEDYLSYNLSARNHNLIVSRSSYATPFYLFLICFDSDIESWITVDRTRLTMKASGFWWRQLSKETQNSSTIQIRIPTRSQLTADTIGEMLDASKNRFSLQ